MSNKDYEGCFTIIGVIALIAAVVLVGPWIGFWIAYFGGWICKITIGGALCNALNITFNTTRFTPDLLPWIAATCGWIGGYFKSVSTSKSNK